MYRVVVDPDAAAQIAALPINALSDFARIYDVVEVAPRSGPSQNLDNPDGAVRHRLFGHEGAGDVVYLVLDRDREVHILPAQPQGPFRSPRRTQRDPRGATLRRSPPAWRRAAGGLCVEAGRRTTTARSCGGQRIRTTRPAGAFHPCATGSPIRAADHVVRNLSLIHI